MWKSNASWLLAAVVWTGCAAGETSGVDTSSGASSADKDAGADANPGAGGAGGTSASGSSTGTGGSINFGDGGTGDGGEDPNCGKVIKAVIRDFPVSHPDFEDYLGIWPAPGLVQPMIGSDQKPIFAMGGGIISSATSFNQWYNSTQGVNETFEVVLTLMKDGSGLDTYDNQAFFPIDNQGFGNEGNNHNYHFTTEVHLKFKYEQGTSANPRIFSFDGDDDLWLFINGRLALDLGGVHFPTAGTLNLDMDAVKLGITSGNEYQMDIFHAERHTSESHFKIQTSIECVTPVDVPH